MGAAESVGGTLKAVAEAAPVSRDVVRVMGKNMHPFEITFFRNFYGLLIMAPWLMRMGFAGLRTARNLPFAGAFVAQKYGKPKSHQHVVQIEIDRSLYMDEVLVEPRADFAEFQAVIAQVVTGLADIGRQDFRLAAQ